MPAANQIFSLFVVKTTVFSSHLYYNNTEPRNPDCHKAFHITVTVFLSHINSKNKGELTMIRRIIHINEEKCNGCGACADACHESAIGMVNGKAKLLRDDYCDGLGDCLPACPTGAITFVKLPLMMKLQ